MSVAEGIKNLLLEQVRGYRELMELLQQERSCLLELDALRVEELSKAKDTLILKLRLLEAERMRLCEECFGGETSLEGISQATGDAEFLEIRSRLLSLSQGIGELNDFNRLLIDKSLHYVRSTSLFFSLFGIGGESSGHRGRLVSGEV